MPIRVMIRGGGDLASGVAFRLHKCGFQVIITEITQPVMVRRLVSYGEAVYSNEITIGGITGKFSATHHQVEEYINKGYIPVIIDPEASTQTVFSPLVLVDGTMRKIPNNFGLPKHPFMIGLGPGFDAGVNCHAAIETKRGHYLGRVIVSGKTEENTGIPDPLKDIQEERVLRAPTDGTIANRVDVGELIKKGDVICFVDGIPLYAPFDGILRGLIHSGLMVSSNMKIGDLDPRGEIDYCKKISDKALAIGGGVLEAILSQPDLRSIYSS